MKSKKSFRTRWASAIIMACATVWAFGPMIVHFTANAENSDGSIVNYSTLGDPTPTGSPSGCAEGPLFATLTGPTIGGQMPRGFAQFRDGNHNELKVFLRFINLPGGTNLDVYVDGTLVGQVELRNNGNGQRFFDVNFPIQPGSMIEIRIGGDVILSGTFLCAAGTPTPTPTGTPVGTPTVSPTGTPVGTPTPTPGVTPSASPNATPTASPSPTCPIVLNLSGSQEVPPNNSPATGTGFVSLSPGNILEIDLSWNGLTTPAIAAHIHGPAAPGQNAGIIFPLAGVTGTSGTMPHQSFALDATQLQWFQSGLLYVNIHTSTFPGGEIRAQITPTPPCAATPTPSPNATPTPNVTPSASPTGTPVFGSPSPSVSPNTTPTATPGGTATPTPSPGHPRQFTTTLRGSEVVPSIDTQARGVAWVRLNADASEIQVFSRFVNLSSSQTTASINCPALPGQNAPVVFDLGTLGGTSGFINETFDINAMQASQLQAGLCYVVIGSQNYSSGEIRGQLANRFMHQDMDGDGQTDVSLFRPSNGSWYYLRSSDGSFGAGQFGASGDRPIAGDFDGDGDSDLVVFRSVGGYGVWYIRNSSDGSVIIRQWGLGNDMPLSGDYDGDGLSDLAVFRPSDGNWYVSRSSSQGALWTAHWGASGDIPVSGDFDGDGTNDPAVFRSSNGVWYVNRSSDSTYAFVQWGAQGDVPISGDFDGDGQVDLGVFRPSEGNWYVNLSGGGSRALHFGATGDVPVPGRFDSGQLADIAVFRPEAGAWYMLASEDNGVTATSFGLNGDIPITSY